MGGYCGDSYYRTKEERRKDAIHTRIFLLVLAIGINALIYFL